MKTMRLFIWLQSKIRARYAMRQFGLSLVLMGVMGFAWCDEFDDMRMRWHENLTGGPRLDLANAELARQLATISKSAQETWNVMDKNPGRVALWPDLADWSNSATLTSSAQRLRSLALAYATTGSALKGNTALASDIVAGLDWLIATRYHQNMLSYGNWWDWQIGTPLVLSDLMILMYGQLTPTQLASYVAAIDWFVPDPTVRMRPDRAGNYAIETGANRLDKALLVALCGVLARDGKKITQGRDAVSQALLPVRSGDGFHADGTFVQHMFIPYVGGYGIVLLDDFGKLLRLLQGSRWSIDDPNLSNVFDWVGSAFRPFMFNGAMMDAVRGRHLSRMRAPDHVGGRLAVLAIANLAMQAPTSVATELKSTVKGWLQRDRYFGRNYMQGLPLAGVQGLQAIMSDDTISAAPEPSETRIFPSTDRAVLRGDGFAIGINMFSQRMGAFESGNGENLAGWWTSAGSTTYYNTDQGQYANDYWPTVDIKRLAGITTDRSGSGTSLPWAFHANSSSWVGGAELGGRYATVGMEFSMDKVTGSDLKGKKSWFLFGDTVVAVGSGIALANGAEVETIVDNRKIRLSGDNVLTVNGETKPIMNGSAVWRDAMKNTRWAHLEGNVDGSDMGYYFPDAQSLTAKRELRSGAWRAIGINESTDLKTQNYLTLALSHGANPTHATYTYVLLPKRSAAATAAYAAAPAVVVLERSDDAVAVADTELGLVGANFWNDASNTIAMNGQPYLTSNKKAAVLTREVGGELEVSVADPTQSNTGTIEVEINRQGAQVLAFGSGVKVAQLVPTIKLVINVNGATGKSFFVKIKTVRAQQPGA